MTTSGRPLRPDGLRGSRVRRRTTSRASSCPGRSLPLLAVVPNCSRKVCSWPSQRLAAPAVGPERHEPPGGEVGEMLGVRVWRKTAIRCRREDGDGPAKVAHDDALAGRGQTQIARQRVLEFLCTDRRRHVHTVATIPTWAMPAPSIGGNGSAERRSHIAPEVRRFAMPRGSSLLAQRRAATAAGSAALRSSEQPAAVVLVPQPAARGQQDRRVVAHQREVRSCSRANSRHAGSAREDEKKHELLPGAGYQTAGASVGSGERRQCATTSTCCRISSTISTRSRCRRLFTSDPLLGPQLVLRGRGVLQRRWVEYEPLGDKGDAHAGWCQLER